MEEKMPQKQDRLNFIFAAAAVALVVFMLMFIPINPMRKYKRSMSELEYVRQDFNSAVMLRDAHLERLRDQEILMKKLNDRPSTFQLWSFINLVLTEQDLKNRTKDLRNIPARFDRAADPSDQVAMVELGLNGVTLKELADVLHRVYSSDNLVVIFRVILRPASNNRGLDCELIFLSPNQGLMG